MKTFEDTVQDIYLSPDKLGRVGGLGPFLADHVEHLAAEDGELAVLDKLAQVGKARLKGLGDLPHHGKNGLDNAALVVKATLLCRQTTKVGEREKLKMKK
jgi:hypothetical protein